MNPVAELIAVSDLTVNQVGRLLGVSCRTVSNWVAGGELSDKQASQVSSILDVVRALPGSTPAEKREWLLDSAHGPSLFHTLMNQNPTDQVLHQNPLSVVDRLGADIDEREQQMREDIGVRAAQRITDLALPLDEICARAGLTVDELKAIVNGQVPLSSLTLYRLADALRTRPLYLVTGEDDGTRIIVCTDAYGERA